MYLHAASPLCTLNLSNGTHCCCEGDAVKKQEKDGKDTKHQHFCQQYIRSNGKICRFYNNLWWDIRWVLSRFMKIIKFTLRNNTVTTPGALEYNMLTLPYSRLISSMRYIFCLSKQLLGYKSLVLNPSLMTLFHLKDDLKRKCCSKKNSTTDNRGWEQTYCLHPASQLLFSWTGNIKQSVLLSSTMLTKIVPLLALLVLVSLFLQLSRCPPCGPRLPSTYLSSVSFHFHFPVLATQSWFPLQVYLYSADLW